MSETDDVISPRPDEGESTETYHNNNNQQEKIIDEPQQIVTTSAHPNVDSPRQDEKSIPDTNSPKCTSPPMVDARTYTKDNPCSPIPPISLQDTTEGAGPISDDDVDEDEASDNSQGSQDELASRVSKRLAGAEELLLSMSEDDILDGPSTEQSADEQTDIEEDEIIDLTVSGKEAQQRKRLSPIVNAIGAVEFHDIREETTPHDKYEGDDEEEEECGDGGSDTATEIYEPVIDDSAGNVERLEQQLAKDRLDLTGETTATEQVEDSGKEDDDLDGSVCGSDDSLHKKVEKSLAGSTLSLNANMTGSENESDGENSEELSLTEGINSRDELEIYDSRELQNGIHQMMNDSQPPNSKERSQTPPATNCVSAMFTINQLKRKFDSVDNIMDRIDAGISTLRKIEMPEKQAAGSEETAESVADSEKPSQTTEILTQAKPAQNTRPYSKLDTMKQRPFSKSTPNLDSLSSLTYNKSYSAEITPHRAMTLQVSGLLQSSDGGGVLSEEEVELDDDESMETCSSGSENHSDLDSDAAFATDAKFSEILRSKQNTLGDPRVSAIKFQDPCTETESIRTEDFESAFQKSLPTDSKTRNGRRPQSIADDSSDTPLTEDFEDRFKASLKAQQQFSNPGSQITSNLRRSHSLPKYQSSLTPIRGSPAPPQARASPVTRRQTPTKTRHSPALPKYTPSKATHQYTGDTLDELSDIEQENMHRNRMRPTSPHHAAPINGHYEADSESEDGDFAHQIREQSNRIQKEIELERRLKSRALQRAASQPPPSQQMPPRPPQPEFQASSQPSYGSLDKGHSSLPRYRGSGSFTNLNSSQDPHAFQAYSASTPDISSLYAAQQAQTLLKNQIEEDSNIMQRMNDDRMQLIQEINRLQDEMKRLEDEVGHSELQAKENRTKAEESRSHLMVAEFKKEAILKEIGRLSLEVEQGKRIIEQAEEKQAQEDDTLSRLNITIDQVPMILENCDQMKAQLDSMERTAEKEKDETSKKLEDAKTKHSIMQDGMQEKVDELRDSVQRLNAHLERVTKEKDDFKTERDTALTKCDTLQRDMTAGDHAKSQALEQTIKGYDDMRRRLEKETDEIKTQLTNELKGTKKLLDIEEQKGTKLREEIQLRDELNTSLREQLTEVRGKAAEEEESHDNLLKDLKQQLREAENEKLAAWDSCKQSFEVEKEKLLESMREDLERQHEEMMRAVGEEHDKHLATLQHGLKTKENENHLLRDRLSQQEQENRRSLEKAKADVREQIEQAVESEKRIWEKEQKYAENEQLKLYRENEANHVDQLRLNVESEVRKRQQVEEHLSSIKSELEESRQYNQRINQEKQAVAHKLKQSENSKGDEADKIKHELKQHYDKIIASLREEIEERDQELERLRLENSSLIQAEADSSLQLEKYEKMMISEINDECKKTADLLGVQPRRAQAVTFGRSSSPSKSRARKRTASRSLTASAVANLRACNEELRNSLSELKSEVTDLNTSAEKSQKIKERELESLRNRLNNEKQQEIEEMRTSLAKMPSCRRSLAEPRDPYQVKVERKASEKALRKSLSGSYTALNGHSFENGYSPEFHSGQLGDPHEVSAAQSMQSVQDRLKHIRAGSPFRYRSNPLANSTPDISNLSKGGMDSLEQKVRLAELKARLADERASRNQAMLTQKMREVNDLQHTLNSQSKEILGLERSYDDLRSAQYSPTKYNLNSTFPR